MVRIPGKSATQINAVVVLSALFAIGAAAQTPGFDAVAIKLAEAGHRGPAFLGCHGGPGGYGGEPTRWICQSVSLAAAVADAYGVDEYRLVYPAWMDDQFFQITATLPAGVTPDQFTAMRRQLFADRFGLVVHNDTKEMSAYQLTVGKGGMKVKPVDGTSASAERGGVDFGPGIGYVSSALAAEMGPVAMLNQNGSTTVGVRRVTMPQLASYFTRVLGAPVIDATGLPGEYTFTLSFLSVSGGGGIPPEVLEEQSGLKLEKRRLMLDVVVVDHCERAPNVN